MADWLRRQERDSKNLLHSWPFLTPRANRPENNLLIGPEISFQPFLAPGYIRKSLGPKTKLTVVLRDSYPRSKGLTTEIIHPVDLKTLAYDRVFVFSREACLIGLYSGQKAQALLEPGGFSQFPSLRRVRSARAGSITD